MRITKTLATAATLAVVSTSAFAGGVAPVIVEPVEVMEAPKTSSVSSTYVVVGVVAALLIAAAASAE
ncbi:hypothetical protein [Yoonia maritima]|uniref:hypothetical protein n=1 Tax=Yoonia maritima TaxID=1435347 RepID=UPI003734F669